MKVGRVAAILAVCVLVLFGASIGAWVRSGVAQAQSPASAIPKSWGSFRSGSVQLLYFEDAAGTVRIYDVNSKKLVAELPRN